ncbi:hypothetical protein TGRUB_321390 [Toxoplasma gondii RUB]|uniref:Uncharacterized protein n=4 Tax=Toxoplasma gondii TaxID=5811 RepID=B9QQL8_TOXGV|nr:hypothetical protein TGVEG_321390 [Toxoplasma gondii VEG]KFG34483.1 hypothetical protein TGFOU_321390 [Toxoplasma gondii FOU]KFG60403.1 hypothetical protein TGRUB_321390 [Toxoplasma gondii RUB]KFH03829.1 hypothetical protein TGMAS_321390 [Toxoplasma gondii MAS]CEL71831.1 TPA: hypothetical protein BN1205_059140 [Toxoplasma gondii VEG]
MKVKSTRLNRKKGGAPLESSRPPRKEAFRVGSLLGSPSRETETKTTPRQSYADVARCAGSPGSIGDESSPSCTLLQKVSRRQFGSMKGQRDEPRDSGNLDLPCVPPLTYADIVKRPQSPGITCEELAVSTGQTKTKSYAEVLALSKVEDETERATELCSAVRLPRKRGPEEFREPRLRSTHIKPSAVARHQPSFLSRERNGGRLCKADSESSLLEQHPVLLSSRSRRNRKRASVSRCCSGVDKAHGNTSGTKTQRIGESAQTWPHYRAFLDDTSAVINARLATGLACCLLSPRHQSPEDHTHRGLTSRRLPVEEKPWLSSEAFSGEPSFDGSTWTSYLADPSQRVHPATCFDSLTAGEWQAAVAISMHLYALHDQCVTYQKRSFVCVP